MTSLVWVIQRYYEDKITIFVSQRRIAATTTTTKDITYGLHLQETERTQTIYRSIW